MRERIERGSLFLLGLASMITQVIVLRMMLTLFSGNELIIGMIFAAWMILTGAGARLGRLHWINGIVFQFWLPLLAALTFLFVPSVYDLIFTPGVETGPVAGTFFVFVVLAPFCLLSGALFPDLVDLTGKGATHPVARGYAIESMGSITGSILVTLVLLWAGSEFPLELILISLYILLLILFLQKKIIRKKDLFLTLPVLAIALVLFMPFTERLTGPAGVFRGQGLLEMKDLPAGEVAITRNEEQVNVYLNRKPLFSTGTRAVAEETVHIPMSAASSTGNILCISAGTPDILEEIMKYDAQAVDVVGIIRGLKEVVAPFVDYPEADIISYHEIAVPRFLDHTERKYDVILVDAPLPASAAMNRFYTQEFYSLLKEKLTDSGLMSLRIPSSPNYLGKQSLKMNSIIYSTLRSVYPHVKVVSSGNIYYISSPEEIRLNILEGVIRRDIPTEYVNPWYFDEISVLFRSSQLENELSNVMPVNKDLYPMAFSGYLSYWLERHQSGTTWIIVLLILFFLYFFIRLPSVLSGVFMAGFTGGSLQFLLLVAFQVYFGTLYLQIGAIIAAFMAGLATGAALGEKIIQRLSYLKIQVLFITVPLLSAWLVPLAGAGSGGIILFALMVLTGFFTGTLFSAGAVTYHAGHRVTASGSYMADLMGSAIGSMGVAVVMLPALGWQTTVLLLAGGQVLSSGRTCLGSKK